MKIDKKEEIKVVVVSETYTLTVSKEELMVITASIGETSMGKRLIALENRGVSKDVLEKVKKVSSVRMYEELLITLGIR